MKTKTTPWEVVESKWRSTYKIRSHEIMQRKNIQEILIEYPLFSNVRLGHLLVTMQSKMCSEQISDYSTLQVNIDFAVKFQKENIHNNIIDKWDQYADIILNAAYKKTRSDEFDKKLFKDDKGMIHISFSKLYKKMSEKNSIMRRFIFTKEFLK